jgi:hypothetical protein
MQGGTGAHPAWLTATITYMHSGYAAEWGGANYTSRIWYVGVVQ